MTITPERRALYGKIEIGRKAIGLTDDDTYRDMLEGKFGVRSRTEMTDQQLVDLVEHLKSLGFKPTFKGPKRAGQRRLADSPHAAKIRALWIALYELGLIVDPSEAELAKFVRRQAKVDDLHWLKPGQADKVIEALKARAHRDAGVDWAPMRMTTCWHAGRPVAGLVDRPKLRVIEAQWRRLGALGALRNPSPAGRDEFAGAVVKSPCKIGLINLTDPQADRVIAALGRRLRKALATQKGENA